MGIKNITTEDKRLYHQRKEKAAELADRVTVAEKNMMLLQEGLSEAKSLVESANVIKHKSFGSGVLEEFDGHYLTVRFSDIDDPKKFDVASALGNGYLTLDTSPFSTFIEKYGSVLRQATTIPQQLKNAKAALEPYVDFLD